MSLKVNKVITLYHLRRNINKGITGGKLKNKENEKAVEKNQRSLILQRNRIFFIDSYNKYMFLYLCNYISVDL